MNCLSINNFVRPNILEDQTLNIVGGRHPSVELAMIKNREGQFHSNNCLLKVDDIDCAKVSEPTKPENVRLVVAVAFPL